jgi:hypothetical protein
MWQAPRFTYIDRITLIDTGTGVGTLFEEYSHFAVYGLPS